jgi:hypothetical protein
VRELFNWLERTDEHKVNVTVIGAYDVDISALTTA